jgi:cytochrome c556
MKILTDGVIMGLAVALACGRPAASGHAADSTGAAAAVDHSAHSAAAHDSAIHAPQALRPIMQRLAVDMSGLSDALWVENYDEMTARAAAIAAHNEISAPEMQRIERTLGPETAAFDSMDMHVHLAAQRMHAAAQARRLDVFLNEYAEVQRGCTACHTQFRGRLRTVP